MHAARTLDAALHGTDLARRAGRVHEGPPVLREDRAGRRVVHRRQRTTSTPTSTPRARTTSRRASGPASTDREGPVPAATASTGLAALGDGLVTNVKKLQTLTTGLTYKPFELANGAQELLDEVAESQDHRRGGAVLAHRPARLRRPTTRAPSRRSRTSSPALRKIDAALTDDDRRAVRGAGRAGRHVPHRANPSGFVLLRRADQGRQAGARRGGQGGAGAAVEGGEQGRRRVSDRRRRRRTTPARRRFLGGALGAAGVVAAGGAGFGVARATEPATRRPRRAAPSRAVLRRAPGRHRHARAGPARVRRVRRHHDDGRRRAGRCSAPWAAAAARMTAGQPIGAVETVPQAPPIDTGEAFGLGAVAADDHRGLRPVLLRRPVRAGRPAAGRAGRRCPPLPGDALQPGAQRRRHRRAGLRQRPAGRLPRRSATSPGWPAAPR